MLSDDPGSALLLGRMAQAGDTPLALLPLAPGPLGGGSGSGVLAVSSDRLWLAQPQLLGGPSVASVPLTTVEAVTVRGGGRFLGVERALQVEVVVDGRPLRLSTRVVREVAEDFARAVTRARLDLG